MKKVPLFFLITALSQAVLPFANLMADEVAAEEEAPEEETETEDKDNH